MAELIQNPITSVLNFAGNIIDKIFPDPIKAQEAKLRLFELEQTGQLEQLKADLQMAQNQTDVNKIEAANENLFVSGWRPFVGWICGAAFGFKYIGGPLLFMVSQALGYKVELPVIETAEMMPLLFGLLGLGGFRTAEKLRGVSAGK